MSTYVSVQYESKEIPGEYGGREYSYIAGIDLAVGDMVVAPVGKSETKARVSAINVPESKIDERVMPYLKTIEKRYEPDEPDVPDEPDETVQEMNVEDL